MPDESSRRTLLCYLTLCLSFFVLIFFLFLRRFSNETIELNLMKYRSSLIQCGKSFVNQENLSRRLNELNVHRNDLINSLEIILSKCFLARQFSLIEQEKPTILRRMISFVRREFFYIVSFFY